MRRTIRHATTKALYFSPCVGTESKSARGLSRNLLAACRLISLGGAMRYAIVADIHANVQAWEAVLRDIASSRIDGIICLGDVVGYGPNPAEVLRSVHSHVDALALGNHDAALCGKLDPVLFNDQARHIIAWTRAALTAQALEVMSD